MEKFFSLPKEFAAKWVAALRSGKYKQIHQYLKQEKEPGVFGHCCLGVAGEICNLPEGFLKENGVVHLQKWEKDERLKTYPIELTLDTTKDADVYVAPHWVPMELPKVLWQMNDGSTNDNTAKRYGLEAYKNYTFAEIADFIEQRVNWV